MVLTINGRVICRMEIADTFTRRFKGLMFKKEAPNYGLLIKPCNSIHTFFMKFSIDVLFVDRENNVIKVIRDLQPGKIVAPVKGAVYVVEGSKNIFESVQAGQKISLKT